MALYVTRDLTDVRYYLHQPKNVLSFDWQVFNILLIIEDQMKVKSDIFSEEESESSQNKVSLHLREHFEEVYKSSSTSHIGSS